MKELRSVVNAFFLFLLCLLAYAFVAPGRARGSAHAPRFLRMEVEDLDRLGTRHGGPKRVTVTVPYGLFGGALRLAGLGRVRRELDLRFEDPVEAEEIRAVWRELKAKTEGESVVRKHDETELRFKKEGSLIVLSVTKPRGVDIETVTLRIPVHFFETLAEGDRDLDVDTLLSQLRSATKGDLVDVEARDAHVRIWIE